ncbi:MAG TPA: ABC transporter substrate-binding protein [Caulobacteraceae bacterium]|nr:ABC transporter substrate-binding protein [Caulobacteraceae bacterium]
MSLLRALHRRRFLTTAWALAACARSTGAGGDRGLTPVRFVTDWEAEAELGGLYQALATGEYAKRGLAVNLISGGPGVNVPQLLAAGAVDMGVGSNSFIVMNLAAQKVPVKAVAAFMQKDPQVLIAHPDAGIETIAEMKGHPVLLADASINAFWVWLKAKYGFTDDQVGKYAFSSAPFLADKRIVQQGYVTSEPYTIEKAGHFVPKVFLLADAGYPGYAGMILASDRFMAAHPEAVRAFIQAAAAGWKSYLYGDPTPADRLILQANKEMTEDVLAQARDKLRRYGIIDSGDAARLGLGVMTDARWGQFFAMASAAGVYSRNMDWKSAYTLQFLPRSE